jgi:MFS transporter, FSR family, fosmidomycin resistance protein
MSVTPLDMATGARKRARRTLALAGLSHALHDGFTDVIFILLPVWQSEFGLGYGALALLRGVNTGAMAAFQIPAGRIAQAMGGRTTLALGTALAAIGYGLAGLSSGLLGLASALALSGIGSSVQHPLASAAVARAYGSNARGPLGIYNFSGDLGKAALPALVSVLLVLLPWRHAVTVIAALGLLVAVSIKAFMPAFARPEQMETAPKGEGRGGFALLFAIGVLDTGVRMGFLIFLPFLLGAKGAPLPMVGFALALVFLGGAAGKFVCGWLGARFGVLAIVLATETGTACGILGVIVLPLMPALILLPLLGMMLNGTSSVLYGTVPELAPAGRTEHAFALFYTGTIGSGAISPILYGLVGDWAGPSWGAASSAMVALLTCPLALWLSPRLRVHRPSDA